MVDFLAPLLTRGSPLDPQNNGLMFAHEAINILAAQALNPLSDHQPIFTPTCPPQV